MHVNSIATIGAICLGICAIPQSWKAHRTKKADDVSWAFLILWFVGDICLLYYGIAVNLPIAILLNNFLNAVCIVVISWQKR